MTYQRKEVIGDATLYLGDCRDVLPTLDPVDVIATDPPYSSGGLTRADRNGTTSAKYRLTGVQKTNPDFGGDNRDQRSLTLWCSDWMAQCHRITRQGGAMLCFIDWRNLTCIVDAIQVGGWVFRGIVPWDKGLGTRPDKGWFRSQVEYIVTASAGPLLRGADAEGICQEGFIHVPVLSDDKEHITGKPTALMIEVLRIRRDWRTVLDPFMGSGTTGVAAARLGMSFIGIEQEPAYFDIACRRIAKAYEQPRLFDEPPPKPAQPSLLGDAA